MYLYSVICNLLVKSVYGYLVISAVLYGSISTIAKPSLSNINPILITALIYLMMGLFLTFIIPYFKKSLDNFPSHSFKLIFTTSIFGAVIAPILYFSGLRLTDASIVSILINAEFLFTIIFALSILKEKPTKMGYLGIAFIFVGLLILNLPKGHEQFPLLILNGDFLGSILIVGATVFWALDNNISKIILHKETPVVRLIQLKSLIGGTISLFLSFMLNISFNITVSQVPALLFLSLGGFAGSLFLFLKGMKEAGAIKSTMIFSTSTLFGIIFAIVFLNEKVETVHIILSIVFIIAGVFLISKDAK